MLEMIKLLVICLSVSFTTDSHAATDSFLDSTNKVKASDRIAVATAQKTPAVPTLMQELQQAGLWPNQVLLNIPRCPSSMKFSESDIVRNNPDEILICFRSKGSEGTVELQKMEVTFRHSLEPTYVKNVRLDYSLSCAKKDDVLNIIKGFTLQFDYNSQLYLNGLTILGPDGVAGVISCLSYPKSVSIEFFSGNLSNNEPAALKEDLRLSLAAVPAVNGHFWYEGEISMPNLDQGSLSRCESQFGSSARAFISSKPLGGEHKGFHLGRVKQAIRNAISLYPIDDKTSIIDANSIDDAAIRCFLKLDTGFIQPNERLSNLAYLRESIFESWTDFKAFGKNFINLFLNPTIADQKSKINCPKGMKPGLNNLFNIDQKYLVCVETRSSSLKGHYCPAGEFTEIEKTSSEDSEDSEVIFTLSRCHRSHCPLPSQPLRSKLGYRHCGRCPRGTELDFEKTGQIETNNMDWGGFFLMCR